MVKDSRHELSFFRSPQHSPAWACSYGFPSRFQTWWYIPPRLLNITLRDITNHFASVIDRSSQRNCTPPVPPDLTTTQTTALVATCKQRLMLSMLLGKATKAGKRVINLYSIAVKLWPRLYSNVGYPGGGGAGGLLGLIFTGYEPLASQSPYPIIVYFCGQL